MKKSQFTKTIALITLWVFLFSNISFALRPTALGGRKTSALTEAKRPRALTGMPGNADRMSMALSRLQDARTALSDLRRRLERTASKSPPRHMWNSIRSSYQNWASILQPILMTYNPNAVKRMPASLNRRGVMDIVLKSDVKAAEYLTTLQGIVASTLEIVEARIQETIQFADTEWGVVEIVDSAGRINVLKAELEQLKLQLPEVKSNRARRERLERKIGERALELRRVIYPYITGNPQQCSDAIIESVNWAYQEDISFSGSHIVGWADAWRFFGQQAELGSRLAAKCKSRMDFINELHPNPGMRYILSDIAAHRIDTDKEAEEALALRFEELGDQDPEGNAELLLAELRRPRALVIKVFDNHYPDARKAPGYVLFTYQDPTTNDMIEIRALPANLGDRPADLRLGSEIDAFVSENGSLRRVNMPGPCKGLLDFVTENVGSLVQVARYTDDETGLTYAHGVARITINSKQPGQLIATFEGKKRTFAAEVQIKMTILIAEDDPGAAAALKEVLENDSYEIIVVNRGEEAERLLNQTHIDVMITDLGLKDGKKAGEDVLKHAKKRNVPTMVYSGSQALMQGNPYRLYLLDELGVTRIFRKGDNMVGQIRSAIAALLENAMSQQVESPTRPATLLGAV